MSFSQVNSFSRALSLSFLNPGGRSPIESGGTFQPTTLEKVALTRATADDQYDNQFVEQFKTGAQNRLNFLVGQLQQAYSALLQTSSAASVAAGNDPNKLVSSYANSGNAYEGVGGYGAVYAGYGDHDDDKIRDIGIQNVTQYRDATFQGGNDDKVNFRGFDEHGAAIDIKQKMMITMRSEEMGAAIAVLAPGFNYKVKEYTTTVSTGGFWSGVNYLYSWRPSNMDYEYLDGYSQNSDAAGFDGYLTRSQRTSGHPGANTTFAPVMPPWMGDFGDGTFMGQWQPSNTVKWMGGGFTEGYMATYSGDIPLFPEMNVGRDRDKPDVNTDADTNNDDETFSNTYYLRKRTASVGTSVAYNVNVFAEADALNNDLSGVVTQLGTTIEDNTKDGFLNFNRINGNAFEDKSQRDDPETDDGDPNTTWDIEDVPLPSKDWMPGSGKIEETFTGKFAQSRYGVSSYEGKNLSGNGSNPIFGNFELARLQAYYHGDNNKSESRDEGVGAGLLGVVSEYENGVCLDPRAVTDKRLGQVRKFGSGASLSTDVDQRPNAQNSMQELCLDILRQPKYRDIMRLGLFKDVIVQGSSNSPAGGSVSASLRLSYRQEQDWENALYAANLAQWNLEHNFSDQGKGVRPGIKAQMAIFQDKFIAKGS